MFSETTNRLGIPWGDDDAAFEIELLKARIAELEDAQQRIKELEGALEWILGNHKLDDQNMPLSVIIAIYGATRADVLP